MEGTGVAAEEQSIIVVHPTTKKPIELPLQLSDVSQQLYTELVEALINLMSNEERLQKAHAMTELGNEMHRLQTENRELRMKVKRLENALVGLEQFSGTLQRKLTHQQQSGSGPLIGMSGVLTLGTESQLQVIKDLTRENVQLKQAVAGIDKGQPQAVETIMVSRMFGIIRSLLPWSVETLYAYLQPTDSTSYTGNNLTGIASQLATHSGITSDTFLVLCRKKTATHLYNSSHRRMHERCKREWPREDIYGYQTPLQRPSTSFSRVGGYVRSACEDGIEMDG